MRPAWCWECVYWVSPSVRNGLAGTTVTGLTFEERSDLSSLSRGEDQARRVDAALLT